MPYEIVFKDYDEAAGKVKSRVKDIEECRIKVNKDNIKLKIRGKKELLTLVFKKDGSNIEELKKSVAELATKLGCKELKEID